ncbi:hypothetical protein UFOVP395_18 [uncultured Caudovirales phage]|jgi:hypothetical protein|uniref:Uncharacterized protein n=1 Tax=uncultured Caudovirales phage TaxID=2100421 RepID=A0A6J5M9E7_9CAUD|nr:hypothetical protein UFOVP395_18 [uncultured Caudovirales phage]
MSKPYNKFVAEPFTNKIGQTIDPGDRVAYVTTCTGRVYQGTGWFDGVYKDPDNGRVVLTRVRGIKNKKTMATGKIITHIYQAWSFQENRHVERSYQYPETVEVDCEPHGFTNLQCHRMFKI